MYNSYENIALEGSAIYPKDLYKFEYDSAVLLVRIKVKPKEMLELSKKYDSDWITKREDEKILL